MCVSAFSNVLGPIRSGQRRGKLVGEEGVRGRKGDHASPSDVDVDLHGGFKGGRGVDESEVPEEIERPLVVRDGVQCC